MKFNNKKIGTFIISVLIIILIVLIQAGFFEKFTSFNLMGAVVPLLIFLITIVAARVVGDALDIYFQKKDIKLKAIDKTRYALFAKLTTALIYVIGFGLIIYSIPPLRQLSYTLFAGAGVLAIVIGFATQEAFANIVSGIFIVIFEPYRIGDKIKLEESFGEITDITMRHTVINTWDNKRIIVPNSVINEKIIKNYSIKDQATIETVEMSISYESDIDRSKEIMREEVMNHEELFTNQKDTNMVPSDDKVNVRVVECADSGVILRLYFWAEDHSTGIRMKYDLLESVKKRFDEEGIDIPYPHRTLNYKDGVKKQQ